MFEYPDIGRIDTPDGRFYMAPGGTVPSVTTVLAASADMSWLAEWTTRVGDVEAERIREEASSIGTAVHARMEVGMRGQEQPPCSILIRMMADGLSRLMEGRLDDVWGIEARLYCAGLYAGTCDLVGVWDGRPAIIDYKTGRAPKGTDAIAAYSKQCAAYAIAHDEMFGSTIESCVILEVTRDMRTRATVFADASLELAKMSWLSDLEAYYGRRGDNRFQEPHVG